MARYVGLDLGASYTRIWTQDKGIILRAPTAAAINIDSNELVAVGERARLMIGKTPENIQAVRPVQKGVIYDNHIAARMAASFFNNKQLVSLFHRPVVLIGVPYALSNSERVIYENTVLGAGARAVSLIPSVFAAAAGAGLPVDSPRGCMVLNMGGGLAEAAVISSGSIINACSIRGGAATLDKLIIAYMRNVRELVIGDVAAEALRLGIGAVDPSINRGEMVAYGRHTVTGLAAGRSVSTAEICEALMPQIRTMSYLISTTLENVPPEITADISRNGVTVCGGLALMPGLCRTLSRLTHLKMRPAPDPLDCVINGLGRVLNDASIWAECLEARVR